MKLFINEQLPSVDNTPRTSPELRYAYRDNNHFNMKIVAERFGDSLRTSIGPIVDWLGVLTAVLVIMVLCGAGLIPAFDGLRHNIATGGSLGGYILGIAACAGLILLVLYSLLLNLFGSETVTVSPTDLQVQWPYALSESSQIRLSSSFDMSVGPEQGEQVCRTASVLTASGKLSPSLKISLSRSHTT
jgi:hypothetical protein